MDISVIIPVYNEEKNVELLFNELKLILDSIGKEYEIIFVDDGSIDKTSEILKKIHSTDKKLRVIHFTKNFGKASALSAGFEFVKGEIIITLDAFLVTEKSIILIFMISSIKE